MRNHTADTLPLPHIVQIVQPEPEIHGAIVIMPLLQLGRALAVIGFTVKSKTWNNRNARKYQFNHQFFETFDFEKTS